MAAITKVWVCRPNSSPTQIRIPSSTSTPVITPSGNHSNTGGRDAPRHVDVELTEDFLVDDLREVILKKYPQSLGKHHDAADLSIQLPSRPSTDESGGETLGRILGPDESVLRILAEEFPGGQSSAEAWIIVTSGGRYNYTRWWLQTGGLSTDMAPLRGGISPNQFIPSAPGSYSSEAIHQQEYFPYVPQTVVTPPGDYPPRLRSSGSSVMTGGPFPRLQGRPPLRASRTSAHEGVFSGRRYDNTNTSSLVVEALSGADSEDSHQGGRGSPDANAMAASAHLRYPPQIRPSSSISGRVTPPAEYPPNRMRQYTQGNKQSMPPTSAPGQAFQVQVPAQTLPAIPQKAQSPLGAPSNHPQPRSSQSTAAVRPSLPNASSATPIVTNEKPQPPQKGATSPKSPSSGSSSNNGVNTTTSPVTRRKSNTISQQGLPLIQKPRSPSPVDERKDSPLPPRVVPLVKAKTEKDTVTGPNKNSAIGVIPPINVLIVEDNFINAQILEVFFRKRKLKYATAVNGKEAVEKWRQGGWHLVLMDIQLPVMSGIEATKEIRRLERVNHIGVFTEETTDKPSPEDELGDLPFPSPVIIVALTASSRESDRNEALAAGCNDFLTKPVGAPWLERKAIEWGCMQALIWTSFERRRRRAEKVKEALENGVAVSPEAHALGDSEKVLSKASTDEVVEKPPVVRGDSGESIETQESTSSAEAEGDETSRS